MRGQSQHCHLARRSQQRSCGLRRSLARLRVAIALGSSLGDRAEVLRSAIDRLSAYVTDLRLSSLHETEPVGVGPQPTFLNAAAVGETALPARDLLRQLLAIEQELGRVRPYPGAPRTLDL